MCALTDVRLIHVVEEERSTSNATKRFVITLAFFYHRQQKNQKQFRYGEQTVKSLTNWFTDLLPQQEALFQEYQVSSSSTSTRSDIKGAGSRFPESSPLFLFTYRPLRFESL